MKKVSGLIESQIDEEKVNEIINQYYYASNQLNQGDLRIALILLDNSIEQSLKLYLDIKVRMDFPKLFDTLLNMNADILSRSEIDEFKRFHITRNKFFHEPNRKKLSRNEIERLKLLTCHLISILFNRWEEALAIDFNENIPIISEFRNILIKIEDEIILFYYNITSIHDPTKDPLLEGLSILKEEKILTAESIEIFNKCSKILLNLKGKVEDIKDLKIFTNDLIKINETFIEKQDEFYEILNDYYEAYGKDIY